MKIKFTLFLLLCSFFIGPIRITAQAPGDSIFNDPIVHELYFEFSQPGYWDSLTTYYTAGNEQYLMATAILDGDTIDSIGVRLKGNSTYNHPNNKKSMVVDFNEFVGGKKWRGLKKIFLNNNWSDPTMMREKITFDFCNQAGIQAPRTTYGNVYLNNSAWGLYSVVEPVDRTFLETRFNDDMGNLFKAVDAFGGGPGAPVSDLKWYGFTQSSYYTHYELKTNDSVNDWSDLMRFIDTLNISTNLPVSLPGVFNLDAFYSHLAVDILFANLDAYVNSARNFYLYHNLTGGQFEWIHWDANMSFGRYSGMGGGGFNPTTMSVTYVSNSTERPLIGKIYNDAQLKSAYLQRLCELKRDYFSLALLQNRIDSIANTIRPHVYADPRKQYTSQQFDDNIDSDITVSGPGGGTTIYGLKSFITERSNSVTSQLNSLGVNCTISGIDGLASSGIVAAAYPNPFADHLTIEKISESGEWKLQLADLFGGIVKTARMPAGHNKLELDLSALSAGIYLLVMSDEDGSSRTIRVVKQ